MEQPFIFSSICALIPSQYRASLALRFTFDNALMRLMRMVLRSLCLGRSHHRELLTRVVPPSTFGPTAEERTRRLAVGETNGLFNRRHIVN